MFTRVLASSATAAIVALLASLPVSGQSTSSAPLLVITAYNGGPPANYVAPRTPWGDPDLQGAYTNSDESLIPMERPDTLSGKALSDVTPEELAKLNEQRNEARVEADKQRWELRSPLHWFENHNPKNSRAWLVVDPPDGKIPPQTAEAKARATARAQARRGLGRRSQAFALLPALRDELRRPRRPDHGRGGARLALPGGGVDAGGGDPPLARPHDGALAGGAGLRPPRRARPPSPRARPPAADHPRAQHRALGR